MSTHEPTQALPCEEDPTDMTMLQPKLMECAIIEDRAYEAGRSTVTGTGTNGGKYLVIYKRVGNGG